MAFQNDIVAYDKTGQLVLVVEVKNKRGTSTEWAIQMRRNLLSHGLVRAPYFLLALPDRFYLWVGKQSLELAAPDFDVDPRPFLKPYFGADDVPEYLTGIGFEMIIEAWLATLTWADALPGDMAENGNWLTESGLFAALKHGHLASEITV